MVNPVRPDGVISQKIVLVQEAQQAQGQASGAMPAQEQAVDETSSLPASERPDSPAAMPDSAAALPQAKAEENSESQQQNVADSSSSQEAEKPADADQADTAHIPPAAPAMADLYHHGDLGPSSRLGGSGESFCRCHHKAVVQRAKTGWMMVIFALPVPSCVH